MSVASEPIAFADSPARDERFDVRDYWRELANEGVDHDLEFLHRQMTEEIESIEMAARNLVDFPDAPWELRMEMARQCWDESRHALAFRRLFEARGGKVGAFPILVFQYRIITKLPSLIGRLAVANRSFEASGLDAIEQGLAESEKRNDPEFVSLFDQQLADELQHVRFANVWINRLVAEGGPRAVFELARAVATADQAFKQIIGDSGITYKVAEGARREAGFSSEEIAVAKDFYGK